MTLLLELVILLPLILGLRLAGGCMLQQFKGVSQELDVVSLCRNTVLAVCLILLLHIFLVPGAAGQVNSFTWLELGSLKLGLDIYIGGFHIWLALLFSVLVFVSFHFSASYLHRERGFFRFHAVLCFFHFAMLLLVLSGSAVFTFIAWEVAGICSWLLIAYNFGNSRITANATRVMIVQRCGDAMFLMGIALMLLWLGTDQWGSISQSTLGLSELQLTVVSCSFVGAALVKSAQVPFTPWLYRAMEGPTPSSAVFYGGVMVHAGVYLLILIQDLLEQSPFAMLLLLGFGFATVVYGVLVGRTQADIKSSMASAAAVQIGLMFMECGLGWWTLAAWHLAGHAVMRSYVFLRTPSILHNAHNLPVKPASASSLWLQQAALQQFWLDELMDKSVSRPVVTLATDITYFEDHVLDPLMGVPAPVVSRISNLVQAREQSIGARLDDEADTFARGSGLAGQLTALVAGISHWFEERFILQGVGRDIISLGRRLGHAANRFEQLLLRPRYMVLFVLITVLVAL